MRLYIFVLLYIPSLLCNGNNRSEIDSLLRSLDTKMDDTTTIQLNISLGVEYSNLKIDSAKYYLIKAKNQAEQEKQYQLLAKSSFYLGELFCDQIHNPDKAEEYYLQAIKYYEETIIVYDIGVAYKAIIDCHREHGNYLKSLDYCKILEDYFIKTNYQKGLLAVYSSYGENHHGLGNNELALGYFQKVFELNKEVGDALSNSAYYNNVGIIYIDLRNFKQALKFLEKSKEIMEQENEKLGLSSVLNNMGISYYMIASKCDNPDSSIILFEKALYYYQQSVEISKEIESDVGVSRYYNNVAKTYEKIGDYDLASEYYNKSLLIKYELLDKKGISIVEGNLANLYMMFSDSEKNTQKEKGDYLNISVTHGLRSMKYAEESNSLKLINAAALLLKQFYSQIENFEKAFYYAEIYNKTQDSLFNISKEKTIQELLAKYQYKENKLELEKKEVEINKHENEKILFTIITVLLILIVMIFIIAYIGIRKRNKKMWIINKRLTLSEERLKAANDSKDKFFMIVAHDLRNPFSMLQTISSFLLNDYNIMKEKTRYQCINTIHKAAGITNELIENLMLWSKSQTGKIIYNPDNINLFDLVEKNCQLLKITAERKSIIIVNKVDKDLQVISDLHMLDTILRNLMSNAVKFSNKNDEISLQSELKKDHVLMSVKDNGIGFSEEDKQKLFRLDVNPATIGKSSEKGTGLGLILSKEFVTNIKGEIWVESSKGVGTTFFFTIPINPIDD
jgi:signal transduction histidine kinase